MGLIQKQTLKGTFYSYLGVAVGFITTGLLFPRILSTEVIGLINLLIAYSVIFAQVGSLGFNSVINRLFPYFRNSKNGHNGFFIIAISFSFIGLLLVISLFFFIKPILLRNNIENSELFVQYIHYLIPLIIFFLFFNLLDAYNKAIYDVVLGTFLKEFVLRLFILTALILFIFNWIGLHLFIQLYILAWLLPTVILLVILIRRGDFRFTSINREVFTRKMMLDILNVCFYGFIFGLGSFMVFQIDKILVNKFLGIAATGIYATNYFFATMVIIPSRALLKISTTVIADAWKVMNIENILLVYQKSVINQGIIGLLIFLGLWVNIDNIYHIIPIEYAEGRMVIFYIAAANLFQMFSGVAGTIIGTSKYYRIQTLFIIIFLACLVGLNLILIPKLGITGAALSFAIAIFFYTILRYFYILFTFKMNPYNNKFLYLLLISGGVYLLSEIIPEMSNFIIDIIVRSSAVLIIYVSAIYVAKISVEVNTIIQSILLKIRQYLTK